MGNVVGVGDGVGVGVFCATPLHAITIIAANSTTVTRREWVLDIKSESPF
jgi:hypothetical protein